MTELSTEEKSVLTNPEHIGAGAVLSLIVHRQQSEIKRMQSTVSRYAEMANQARKLLVLSVPEYLGECLCSACLQAKIEEKENG